MTKTNNGEFFQKLGIYVHIPFCVKKCAYCDFLSFENEAAVVHKVYAKALVKEIESRALAINKESGNYSVDTVFIGGGTPSLLLPSMVKDIIDAVKLNFNTDVNSEITIEANPGTLQEQKLEGYLTAGVNRLSLGAQSFNSVMLKLLGRIHCSLDISRNVNIARSFGFNNINLDLMFAIPHQTIEMWEDTLARALELSPEHISFYSLQIEEGTRFYEMFGKGLDNGVSDESDREMYHLAVKKLSGAGYAHYEISNASKPGYECRHNLKYWSMGDYLGAGLGAHSFIDGKRSGNIKDFDSYIEINLDSPHATEYEKLREWLHVNSISDDISEYMFTGLRLTAGIDFSDFERRFKKPVREIYAREWPAVERFVKDGLLLMDGGNMRLSPEGIDISNKIMSEFILLGGEKK